ncbi:MAG: ATP-dependent Clp protease proteolytic subunit [Alistipes sp.]|nr:ATP-dependent Clp protease proteolytic subunit [Alistipes sp.]MBO5398825.1 ATP-dependent Clp protease proteolytic subunit [Alistipes sp.]
MQTKITIRNEAQTCYIDIEGTIGVEEKHQFERGEKRVATFEAFRREVERIAGVAATNVVVNIRSTGGDVNDALLIYDTLKSLDARITTRCYGYTASAATIIAQAADEGQREISDNAMYLIHRSTCSTDGNASSLESKAELLRKTDEQLARLYAERSGRDAEFFAELMAENGGEGRWLTATEAVEAGLADTIIDNQSVASEGLATDTAPQVKDSTTAGDIVRYLLTRLAYRIEEWIDRLYEKHQAKREAKRAEKEAKKAEKEAEKSEPEPEQEAADSPDVAPDVAPDVTPDASPEQSEEALPKATLAAPSRSAIAFDEGQRRYAATDVKPTEDPSMNQPTASANSRAYADDARAFGKY